MKTEFEIAATLKQMMETVALENISVVAITKKCKINRQTFYYHYHDVFDVLTVVFLNEKISGLSEVKNKKEMVECIFNYYDRNRKFITASLNSAGKDLVKEFFYNACYQTVLRFVVNAKDSEYISIADRKSIARFYASAYAYSIVYYLTNYQIVTLSGLINSFGFSNDNEIPRAIQNLLSLKGKV